MDGIKLSGQMSSESDELYTALTEHAPVAIIVYDVDQGKFIEANKSAIALFGVSKEALLDLGLRQISPKPVREGMSPDKLFESHIDQVMDGASFIYEWSLTQESGKNIPCEVRLVRLPVEGRRHIRISLTEISDRKNAIDALNVLTESNVNDLDKFLQICVQSLASAYGSRYAFIGLLLDKSRKKVATNAVWTGEGFVDNFEYDLKGTPCADILDRSKKLIPRDAARLYPDDEILVDMGVESYFGSPLVNSIGETIGLVSVFDVKPMELTPWTSSVLGIFSQRIAFEIEYHRAKKQIKSSENELSTILDDLQDVFFRIDNDGKVLRITNAVHNYLGYKPEELLNTSLADLYLESDGHSRLLEALEKSDGTVNNYITPLKHKSGNAVWVSTNAHYYFDDNNKLSGIEGTARDITNVRKTEAQMHKLSMALEQSADLVMITDSTGIIEYVNYSFEQITGYTKEEALGTSPNIVKSGKQNPEFYNKMWQTISCGKVFNDVLINKRKDGTLYYEQKTITPLKDPDGKVTHFVSTGKDITERMHAQEKLEYLAHHDPLTELPNRTLFLDRLKHALARARWHKRLVVVMFLDLDRFKTINDSLGHDIGDRLLRLIAQRLEGDIRDGDTVARLGGDEFAILMDDIASENDISVLAKNILTSLEPKFDIEGREFYVTASIGVSSFPNDGDDSNTLLKNADIAMYKAKDMGKNTFQFYSTEMSAKAFERLALESSLRRALELDEFVLHYQPQIDVDGEQIVGVESLIRWQHPELGLVSPLEFIPLLEETGQIIQVGEWVLRSACEQAVKWREEFISQALRMSVNLSSRQFNDPDFVLKIKDIINDTGINPQDLELEITESILMRNATATTEAINTLHDMGVRFAIDDFGTGYSSLSYLRRFPIDTLKIDRSFIRDITTDPDDAAITKAIIVMGQSLKMDVIAEGVETEDQLAYLRSNGCQSIQGYLFCKPLAALDITDWLRDKSINNTSR